MSGSYDNIFLGRKGKFDHLSAAAGLGSIGIDVAQLLQVARRLPAIVGHEVPGQVAKAGRISDLHPAPAAVHELKGRAA